MWTYTNEVAVHGWDLAQATGNDITIDDEVLQPVIEAARLGIPAEARGMEDFPFGPVVEPPSGATVLEQLVAWCGRSAE